MDALLGGRRTKDKSYKNVFKGSVLVSTLMDHDQSRFASRQAAVKFAQKLLDCGHVESIVGASTFEDSVHLYRWSDETVVREAKKMVNTGSSHIPKKKLIELVDLQQTDGGDDAFVMKDVKEKLFNKGDSNSTKPPVNPGTTANSGTRRVRRERAARRQTVAGDSTISNVIDNSSNAGSHGSLNTDGSKSTDDTNLLRSSSLSSEGIAVLGGDTSLRVRTASPLSTTGSEASESRAPSVGSEAVVTSGPRRRRSADAGGVSADPPPRLSEIGASRSRALDSTSSVRSRTPDPDHAAQTKPEADMTKDQSGDDKTKELPTHKAETTLTLSSRKEDSAKTHSSKDDLTQPKPSEAGSSTKSSDAKLASVTKLDNSGESSSDKKPFVSSITLPDPSSTTDLTPDELLDREIEEEAEARSIEAAETDDMRVLSPVSNLNSVTESEAEEGGKASEHGEERDGEFSTCRYDGIDMPALDLENLDFNALRPGTQEGLSALTRSLDDLAEQSGSYSDNEKQLLERMRQMQQEHANAVCNYEDQINDLMRKIHELRSLADILEQKGITTMANGDATGQQDPNLKNWEMQNAAATETRAVCSLAPTPPAPPPPSLALALKLAQPSKPAIKPRVKMRPLFWNRIILQSKKKKEEEAKKEEEEKEPTFWDTATEPNFDVDEFERLFGKSTDKDAMAGKSLHDSITSQKGKGRMQAAKILEENRSRAVGIKLRSMHCGMEDICHAVYNMDFSRIELDSLYGLYEVRGTKDELDKITVHTQAHEDVPLDQPEQFLLELSQMSHFPERIECMMLRKRFNEVLFNIDQQLSAIRNACQEIRQNDALKSVLELILAFGNYMNGGTQRGQADGFDLNILAKLRDVKSTVDNNLSLLQFIVRVHCREYEEDAGKNEATFPLPDPSIVQQATIASFVELDADLNRLQYQLKTHGKKAELVCLDTDPELIQPFKDQMDDFFDSADEMLKSQQTNLTNTRTEFQRLLYYLAVKDTTEQVTPETLFGIWHSFLDSYQVLWKEEQKRIARQMFEKIEQRKKERIRSARRRKSAVEGGKNNMKQRFAQIRRRSEQVVSANFLRSQSTSGMDQANSDGEGTAPRRRRVRPQSEILDGEEGPRKRGETMAERMQRRRRSRVNSEDVISGNPNLEQIVRRPRSQVNENDEFSERSTERGSRARRERFVNGLDPAPVAEMERFGDHGQRRRRSHQSAESDSGEVFTEGNQHQPPPSARRRQIHDLTDDSLDTSSQASYESGSRQEGSKTRRRRAGTVEAPPPAMHPGDGSRTRQAYRGAKSECSISDAAQHKPPRDRSPLPANPPSNASAHFQNLMKRGRAKFTNNNKPYDTSDAGYSCTMSSTQSTGDPPTGSSGCSSPDPQLSGSRSKYVNPYSRSLRAEEQNSQGATETASKASYREALRKLSRAHANSMFGHEQTPVRTSPGADSSRSKELSPPPGRTRGAESPPSGRRRDLSQHTRLR